MKFVIIILVTLPCLTWEIVATESTPITTSSNGATTVVTPTVSISSATTLESTTVDPKSSAATLESTTVDPKSSASTLESTTVDPKTSSIAVSSTSLSSSTNSVAVTTSANTALSSETTRSVSISAVTSPTTTVTTETTATGSTTPELQCFDINCTGDTCIGEMSKLTDVNICNVVSGGACFLSRENEVYVAGCMESDCEWSSVITQTGKTKSRNCCTTPKCNNDLALLENSGSVVYLSFVLIIGLQVFTYVF